MKWLSSVVVAVAMLLPATNEAAFNKFQLGYNPDPVAVTSCNLNTGACTGQDAGTGLFTAAVCDGVTDMSAAFTSFNTWARALTTNTNGQLIEATVTGTCLFSTGNVAPFRGLKNYRLMAYGATFTGTGHLPNLGPSDTIPGICHKGIADASGCSARINTVSSSATAVTITDTSLCSRFVTGKWAVVTGFDLQGGITSFGYPPNPHFFDYVQIGSTASCAGSGVIQLGSALTNNYLSTWPNFGAGTSGESDQGGPATIYALDQYWGGTGDVRGFTLNDLSNQSIYQGYSMTIKDITMNGANCLIPSQNKIFTMVNSTGTSCNIEVDKLIDQLTYSGTSLNRLSFQSSSTNTLTWTGGSLALDMNGTPKVANMTSLTTPTLRLGPQSFGTATSATCTNCAITNQITSTGLQEKGPSDPGANLFYAVSGGVFSYPVSQNVTAFADNGSGKVRLTVANATGWVVNAGVGLNNVCTPGCSGGSTILAVNTGANTIDININFASVTWSGTGTIYNGATQERWAVPGTNVAPTSISGIATGTQFFQVNGVTQSGGFVNIATTLAGTYPNVPLSSGKSFLQVQTPKWTCTNCTGNSQMVDFSGAPASIPFASYSNRTWACTGGPPCTTTTLDTYPLWGKVTSIKLNVTQAYTGSTSPFRITYTDIGVDSTGTFASFNGSINLRQSGLRTITPSGVTCDTGGGPIAGPCTGDLNLSLTDPNIVLGQTLTPSLPNGTPTDGLWSISGEFVMSQGVVP